MSEEYGECAHAHVCVRVRKRERGLWSCFGAMVLEMFRTCTSRRLVYRRWAERDGPRGRGQGRRVTGPRTLAPDVRSCGAVNGAHTHCFFPLTHTHTHTHGLSWGHGSPVTLPGSWRLCYRAPHFLAVLSVTKGMAPCPSHTHSRELQRRRRGQTCPSARSPASPDPCAAQLPSHGHLQLQNCPADVSAGRALPRRCLWAGADLGLEVAELQPLPLLPLTPGLWCASGCVQTGAEETPGWGSSRLSSLGTTRAHAPCK